MSNPKYSTVNISSSLVATVDARCRDGEKRGPRLAADMEDYYTMLDTGLRRARAMLSPDEARLILDTQSSAFAGPIDMMAGRLVAQVTDSIALDGLADKWGVDSAALLDKLANMGDLTLIALLDWTRQIWGGDDVDIDEAVKIFRGTCWSKSAPTLAEELGVARQTVDTQRKRHNKS